MTELEQRKIEAEITYLQAQTAKATAEAEKLDDDRRSSRSSFGHWCVETAIVVRAVILGAGGIIATITGYQLAEVKRERTLLETEQLKKDKAQLQQDVKVSLEEKFNVDKRLKSSLDEVKTVQTALEDLKSQFMSLKQSSGASLNVEVVDRAIATTQKLQDNVSEADRQLRFARTEDTTQKQTIEQNLTAAGIEYVAIRDTRDQGQGYVVVLGSYKKVEDAVRNLKAFRAKSVSREVKLYYAINDYYAAALGIIGSKDEATNTIKTVKAIVSDAYIYLSAAFPYEVQLKEP